jgi:hypothetical protein
VQRSTVHEVLRSTGQPLGTGLREEMEARFGGADFSDVRLHNDSQARRSAEEVGARAYTSGSSVVIGAGGADKHTLAHELGHVLQQRQGPVGDTVDHRGLAISSPTDHLEVAAERQAHEVMSAPVPVLRRPVDGDPEAARADAHHTPTVQRAPLDIVHQGAGATAREMLDSDQEDDVRDYVFTSLGKGDREAVELILKRLQAVDPTPKYLENLTEVVSAFPSEERPRIPPLVHFIWIGGNISKGALDNVVNWAGRAKNTDWRINLWTDRTSKWSKTDSLKVWRNSIVFRYIEDALDERLATTYKTATTGPQKAFPLASDIARYSILKKYGGVYADVDLGAGRVELKETGAALRKNDAPVLGPLIRDTKHLNTVLGEAGAEKATGRPTAEQIKVAADYLLSTGGYGNHFIAVQKDSAVMEKMISKIAGKIEGMDAEELHMAGPAATGPFALMQVVDEHLSAEFGVESLQRGEHSLFQAAGKHFHDQMQWLTAESENQNY